MEKLILTTYRKIVKMGASLDQDVAKRSVVSCAPTSFFNHRTSTWTEVDIAKEVGWPEPRAFLDKLIRRLNGNRENYIPPTAEELEVARATAAAAAGLTGQAATTPAAGTETAGAASTPAEPSAQAASSSARPSATRAAVIAVPPSVEPFMPVQRAARVLFETTPFSMNNLNKAFAAVKELSYACENFRTTASAPSSSSKSPVPRLVSLPAELDAMPTPALTRAMAVAPAEDLQLMHGLSDDLRESLRMMGADKGDIVRHAGKRGNVVEEEDDDRLDDDDEDDDGEVVVTIVTDMGEDADMPSETPHIVTGEVAAESEADLAASLSTTRDAMTAAARTTVFSPAASSADSGELRPPATVQFLVAHPQLTGFFQNAVMLVVRNAENEAIALVLNSPLRRDAGTQLVIARDAICGFPGAHPIYEKHLQYNSVMIGGPVQTGESPDEVALLHQIPGVPGAMPLAENLFLHGDLDAIMQKLDAGEASARDIALVVGFAGWGRDQLQGEVRSGVWLVAQGPTRAPETGDFVMDLARAAGASLLVPPALTATIPESVTEDAKAAATEEVTRGVRRHVNLMATVRDGTVLSWILALKAMGEPYASLARNQKRSGRGKPDDFMK